MLKHRIITAIILICITLIILFYSSPPFFLLVTGLLTLAAAGEWANLMDLKNIRDRLIYIIFMIVMLGLSLFVPINIILLCAVIWWILTIPFIFLYPRASHWFSKNILFRGLAGVFVLIPCFRAINFIREQPTGIYALLFLFVLIWGADSAAYFVGKKWGKRKLVPNVSPGKSLEGLSGAVIFTIMIAAIALWLLDVPKDTWMGAVILSIVTVLFSVVGDLFESLLKRQVGLKDSGRSLPGHGGLLDRIDSLTAAAPIFAFGALILSSL